MTRKKSDAWDVKLTDEEKVQLASDLCREIDEALSARSSIIGPGGKIDYLNWLYEQGRQDKRDLPFAGAADLNSFLITQDVDAMRARWMNAIYSVQPMCTVDVWGDDAKKSPYIEEFHQWQQREEGLAEQLSLLAHQGLIEEAGIIEVRQRIETRRTVETIDAAIQLGEDGAVMLDAEGKPTLLRDAQNEFVPAQMSEPSAKVEVASTKTKRMGPEYDVISLKDFGYLPVHAKNQRQVWGYYKRFWERLPTLEEKVQDKIYDQDAVELLGDQGDREDAPIPPTADSIAPQYGPSAEKELFELSLKRDLDGDKREEWYVVTLSLKHRVILRLKRDKFSDAHGPRCVPFVPCPRTDSVYGYSYAEKLSSIAEEHAALRNSTADRNAMAVSKPMKVLQGGAYDPDAEPWGVGAIIHVRSMDEVQEMDVSDVPQSSIHLLRDIVQANERVSGLSDVGVVGAGDRQSQTLGQDQLVAGASNIRVEEGRGHLATAISRIMQLRHAIWIETLEEDSKGLEAPSGVREALEMRGQELQSGRFTADQLKARVWFNAYGTTDTADSGRRIQYVSQGLIALTNLAKVIPAIQFAFGDPEVAMSVMDEILQAYKFRNRAPWVKALRMGLQIQQQQAALPDPGGMMPGGPMGAPGSGTNAPGMGTGAPPMPPGEPPPEIARVLAMLQQGSGPVVN